MPRLAGYPAANSSQLVSAEYRQPVRSSGRFDPKSGENRENPDAAARRFTPIELRRLANMRRPERSFHAIWLDGRSIRIQQERRSAFSSV